MPDPSPGSRQEVYDLSVRLILLLGVASLLGSLVSNGARSVTGPYILLLGGSAAVVGLVAGFGEFIGYALRFATGTYIIWYPLLQRPEPQQMVEKLKKQPLKSWLHVSLTVQTPSIDGFGMHGSGLFIVNPPYTLPQLLTETMPVLLEKLGLDEGADYVLESQIT